MKYMGSKNRHAKDILPIVLKGRLPGQWYVEPFVGGFNMIDKVDGNRIANDFNYYLIELFRAIQNGWLPPTDISENEYKHIKDNKDSYPPELVGFVGFGCSYGGVFFNTFARGGFQKNGKPRNYCNESRTNILKQKLKIEGVIINYGNYWDLEIPENSIIYCDPPYQGTSDYKIKFDHDEFWQWARDKVGGGINYLSANIMRPMILFVFGLKKYMGV